MDDITTQDKIKIMQAFVNGEEVEFRSYEAPPNITWQRLNTEDPIWNWQELEYRIKSKSIPTPKMFPPGTVVRKIDTQPGCWCSVLSVLESGLWMSDLGCVKYTDPCIKYLQFSSDGGKTWFTV